MKYIIDFYKELDTVNLIVFWGTIIVVILLLTFSIILANKNKKLKYIIRTRGLNVDNYNDEEDDLAIRKDVQNNNDYSYDEQEENITINQNYYSNEQENKEENITVNQSYYSNEQKENNTTINEHNYPTEPERPIIKNVEVINHNYYSREPEKEKTPETTNIEIVNHNYYSNENSNPEPETKNIVIENKHVEKTIRNEENVNHRFTPEELVMDNESSYTKELNRVKNEYIKEQLEKNNNPRVEYSNQPKISKTTIVVEEEKKTTPSIINTINEREKRQQEYQNINEKKIVIPQVNSVQRQKEIAEEVKKQERREDKPKGNYLEEISKSLSKITKDEGINRTEYEIEQEENAIISYKELMEKKDSIKTVDEEEAVISIEELMAKKKEQEKLYNITNESEDENFIDELKNFRSDL